MASEEEGEIKDEAFLATMLHTYGARTRGSQRRAAVSAIGSPIVAAVFLWFAWRENWNPRILLLVAWMGVVAVINVHGYLMTRAMRATRRRLEKLGWMS